MYHGIVNTIWRGVNKKHTIHIWQRNTSFYSYHGSTNLVIDHSIRVQFHRVILSRKYCLANFAQDKNHCQEKGFLSKLLMLCWIFLCRLCNANNSTFVDAHYVWSTLPMLIVAWSPLNKVETVDVGCQGNRAFIRSACLSQLSVNIVVAELSHWCESPLHFCILSSTVPLNNK